MDLGLTYDNRPDSVGLLAWGAHCDRWWVGVTIRRSVVGRTHGERVYFSFMPSAGNRDRSVELDAVPAGAAERLEIRWRECALDQLFDRLPGVAMADVDELIMRHWMRGSSVSNSRDDGAAGTHSDLAVAVELTAMAVVKRVVVGCREASGAILITSIREGN